MLKNMGVTMKTNEGNNNDNDIYQDKLNEKDDIDEIIEKMKIVDINEILPSVAPMTTVLAPVPTAVPVLFIRNPINLKFIRELASMAHGMVGSDLLQVVKEAHFLSLDRFNKNKHAANDDNNEYHNDENNVDNAINHNFNTNSNHNIKNDENDNNKNNIIDSNNENKNKNFKHFKNDLNDKNDEVYKPLNLEADYDSDDDNDDYNDNDDDTNGDDENNNDDDNENNDNKNIHNNNDSHNDIKMEDRIDILKDNIHQNSSNVLYLDQADFSKALTRVSPSALREVSIEV
jgi:SpoVK/Ycf46/Vps4 family AAA+-type ATPase